MLNVILKPGKEQFVKRFHPWIFSGAIANVDGSPSDGDLAKVLDKRGNPLGIGHFHHGSITVRMLSFEADDPTQLAFWTKKVENAFALRRTLGLIGDLDTTCYRLVHGEGDNLSGLIVDVYGDTAVLQCHSIGMHRQRDLIAQALRSVLGKHIAVYDKSSDTLPPNYAAKTENGYILGKGSGIGQVAENGVRFAVNWAEGQKTGFFLDQRDNRLLLTKFARGKSVLNTFCYTGGFSAYALAAGAKEVYSVDSSAKAIELTKENIGLNAPFDGTHEAVCDDVLSYLNAANRQYELLVVDPPAFAKSIEKRHNAVMGYKRLNEAAIRRTAPGGVIFTFSCSQVVDRQLFYDTIVAAALDAGRQVRVLHHLTQGGDHPVNAFHPEGAYLKGLVLYID